MEAFVLTTLVLSFGIAAAIIGIAGLLPRYREMAKELWAFYRSEFVIIACVLVPAALGAWYFAAVLLALMRRGQVEMFRLFDAHASGIQQAVAVAAAGAMIVAATLGDDALMAMVFAGGVAAVALVGLAEYRSRRIERTAIGVATLIYPGLLAALLSGLRAGDNGFAWVFVTYATVEISDTFALLIGKLIGRTHIFPKLSPKKTAEGLLAGFVFGGAGGMLLAHAMIGLSWPAAAKTTAAMLVLGLAGDLIASGLKRWQGKKDFAPLMHRHGGALDIYDSFLFTAPLMFLLRPWLVG